MKSARAFILAGGFGTRIRVLNDQLPKPMIPLAGRPIIFRQIDALRASGITDITVIGGYLGDLLRAALLQEYGDAVAVVIESSPLGTGGCLSLVRDRADKTSLVISGDLLFDLNFDRLLSFHQKSDAVVTLTVHPNTHPMDSDLVCSDHRTGRVSSLLVRPHPPTLRCGNQVNASIAVLEPQVWDLIPDNTALNFEKDIVRKVLADGMPVFAYSTPEYIRDVGTPERLRRAEADLLQGRVKQRCLDQKQRAILFDRDGVLNRYRGLIVRPEDIELESGAVEALKLVNSSGFLAILVSNQPQVARGLVTLEGVDEINHELEMQLGRQGTMLDGIFFCPHHPDKGYPEENPLYKIDCECRKPKAGLLREAAERFNIDLFRSFMVGDATSDVLAGARAGAKTVLVKTGLAGTDGKYEIKPDFYADHVLDAVRMVIAQPT